MLRCNRGDTLVEVLFAVTVFSFVSVMGISLMNQSTATAERSLEINLVRQEIDSQAEVLRFLNNSYIAAYRSGVTSYPVDSPAAQWYNLTHDSSLITDVSDTKIVYTDDATCPANSSSIPQKSFVFNARNLRTISAPVIYSKADTYSRVEYDSLNNASKAYGLWILQVKPTPAPGNNYIDFYIRACWDNPGQSMPLKDGTLVRLYVPA